MIFFSKAYSSSQQLIFPQSHSNYMSYAPIGMHLKMTVNARESHTA